MHEPIPQRVEELAKAVVDAAYRVHVELGPGLMESVYHKCMVYELRKRGIPVRSKHPVPIVYDGHLVGEDLQIDILVDDCLILELKAVETMHPVYTAQLLTYLKLTKLRLGLLINFNVRLIKEGIKRVAL